LIFVAGLAVGNLSPWSWEAVNQIVQLAEARIWKNGCRHFPSGAAREESPRMVDQSVQDVPAAVAVVVIEHLDHRA